MKQSFSKQGLMLVYPGFQNEAKIYQCNRIVEEFQTLGIQIDKIKVDEMFLEIEKGKRTAKIIRWVMIPVFIAGCIVAAVLAKHAETGGLWYVICPFMPVIFMFIYAIFVKLFTIPLEK